MISNILTRIFGSRNERLLKQYTATVREINALEPAIAARLMRHTGDVNAHWRLDLWPRVIYLGPMLR